MCWTEADDSNCESCEEIFAKCPHDTTFLNDENKEECVFCEKEVWKDYCQYCRQKFYTVTKCSQSCER